MSIKISMKKSLPILLCILFIILTNNCSRTKLDYKKNVLSGIVTFERNYSKSTFINKETIEQTFNNNNLDFWIIATDENNKEMEDFRINIRNAAKKLKNKHLIEIPISESRFYHNNQSEIMSIYSNGNRKHAETDDENVSLFREIQANVLFNVYSIKYDGSIQSSLQKYMELLDKGYILAPVSSSEVLGPDWNINNNLRLNMRVDNLKKDGIIESIRKKNFYITFDKDVYVDFKINNNVYGDIIYGDNNLFEFYMDVKSPSLKIKSAEIITNNNEILFIYKDLDVKTFTKKGKFENRDSFKYYYLKIYFENGNTAFTAPIWSIKEKKLIINNIIEKPILSFEKRNGINISFNVENISEKNLSRTEVTVKGDVDYLYRENLTFKKWEKKKISIDYYFDNTGDETINIQCRHNEALSNAYIKTNKNTVIKKILFDGSHKNIFSDDMNKIVEYLNKNDYYARVEKSIEIVDEYNELLKYDAVIVTAPNKVFDLIDQNMKLFISMNKYVYNGGTLILAGYDDKNTEAPIIFMNELLRVVYSPVRFRVDGKFALIPIGDDMNNFRDDSKTPVFHNIEKFDQNDTINSIYLKNPIEFVSQNGLPVNKLYNVKPLIVFSETTNIKGAITKNFKDRSAGIVHNFGFGKVVVLSGINFTDYDLDNLDNKEWFTAMLTYVLKKR